MKLNRNDAAALRTSANKTLHKSTHASSITRLVQVIKKPWLCDIDTQAHPVERHLTVSAVIPGNKRRRPTLRFICVLTLNFAVVFSLHTVSQFTAERENKNNTLTEN